VVAALLAALLAPSLDAADPPGVYQAPDPEPTAEETLILEFINRCRANPPADALRIAPLEKKGGSVDYGMFREEMAKFSPVQPLVFHLDILKAARWHSHYQILNGQTHVQEKGKPGFCGVEPMDRVKAAGAKLGNFGENCFSKAQSPWNSHEAFVIDWGEGPGGMQPKRGHRENILKGSFNVAGTAALPDGSHLAVTHVLGSVRQRFAGGVVYDDRNRNRFYDPGEGVGGITIAHGDQKIQTWKSGAYTLPLSGGAGSKGEVKLSVELAGKTYSKRHAAGDGNIKFDVIIPSGAELTAIDSLLKSVESIPDTEATAKRRFVALVRLFLESQAMLVDDDSRQKIEALTKDVAAQIAAAQQAVREAFQSSPADEVRDVIRTEMKTYAGTSALSWFQDALVCVAHRENVKGFQDVIAGGKPLPDRTLARELEAMQKAHGRLKSEEWQKKLEALGKDVTALREKGNSATKASSRRATGPNAVASVLP
jgi:hypothetical protein